MSELELSWVMNKMPKSDDKCLEIMSLENVEKARRFHKSFPQYGITAMADLKKLAQYLGLGGIYVKDERSRFGLNAFKVLGGSYAIASGDVVLAPSADGFMLYVYYYDHNSQVLGGYSADCIKR